MKEMTNNDTDMAVNETTIFERFIQCHFRHYTEITHISETTENHQNFVLFYVSMSFLYHFSTCDFQTCQILIVQPITVPRKWLC